MLKLETKLDLDRLIEEDIQESLTLDYKDAQALEKTDRKRNELCKDVSAFANSAGGQIIYGIQENDTDFASRRSCKRPVTARVSTGLFSNRGNSYSSWNLDTRKPDRPFVMDNARATSQHARPRWRRSQRADGGSNSKIVRPAVGGKAENICSF